MEPYYFGDPRLPERFWVKVDPNGPIPAHAPELGPCWVWTKAKHRQGYGQFRWDGKTQLAHRVAFVVLVGFAGELDHLCHNPACVRPDHLDPVTHQINTRRGNGWSGQNARKDRCPSGHRYTVANTITAKGRDGGTFRRCRKCTRARQTTPAARKRNAEYLAGYRLRPDVRAARQRGEHRTKKRR